MRPLTPTPILLALTLLFIVGAVAYLETRLDATGADASDSRAEAQAERDPPVEKTNASATAGYRDGPATGSRETVGATGKSEPQGATNRIASKEAEYSRAEELVAPSAFISASDFSIKEAAQEKVVLLEFWTYTCYNCQAVQPYLNAWHDECADEGLQVVGVHTPSSDARGTTTTSRWRSGRLASSTPRSSTTATPPGTPTTTATGPPST
jgi:hypothetical protein